MNSKETVEIVSRSFRTLATNKEFTNIVQFLTQFLVLILLFFIIYFLIHIGNQYVDRNKAINIGKKQILYVGLVFLGVFCVILLFQSGTVLYDVISPFLYAIIIAYIFNPFVNYIENKGIQRIWAVFIVYFIISGGVLVFSLSLLPKMTAEIRRLLDSLPNLKEGSFGYIYDKYINYNNIIENLPVEFQGVKDILKLDNRKLEEIILKILSSVTNSVIGVVSKLLNIVITPILAFYFLKDKEKFKKMLILLIPKYFRKGIIDLSKDIDGVLGGFIRGQLIVAFIIGVLTTIIMMILRVEFAVLVGIVAGFADLIPYFGPIIGIIPGIIFASFGGLNKVLWVIVLFFVIQQAESSIISPKIISDKVGIHPIVVILALIIGGKFFGVLGLLIAVPAAGIIKVIGKHFINYIANF